MHLPIADITVGVVGGGSWGTAVANLLALKGFRVDWWIYEAEVREQVSRFRENRDFLPRVPLSLNAIPTADMALAVKGKDVVFMVVPSHFLRDVALRTAPFVEAKTLFVSASKGIENDSYLTMSAVLHDAFTGLSPDRIAALSWPTFAVEVARQVPSVATVASTDARTAFFVQHVLATPFFRVYTSADVVGVELCGALKNIIAIASGIVDGLNLGLNTRAALITRGLAEMRRLGVALGADPDTFMGLAGVGDLVLTCTGDLSRNHTVGKKIGEGMKLPEILAGMRMVAEGVKTAKSVYHLSRRVGVEMPICSEVYAILYEDASPSEALYRLMTRELKQEKDEA